MEALFGIDDAEQEKPPTFVSGNVPVRGEQVDLIRAEFERLGIASQRARKDAVDAATFRSVLALKELTAVEARRLINQLRVREPGGNFPPTGSAWDTRDEATWIDKL